jgi:hypothetical protein
MNPDTAIRPWLLAVGEQFGIREAHEYRWADADTHPGVMYFTYRVLRSSKNDDGLLDITTADGNDAINAAAQEWNTLVQVDLYRSQGGIGELASCCLAAQDDDSITGIFDAHGISFVDLIEDPNDDQTSWDDEEIKYHHRMICRFFEFANYELRETNKVVQAMKWALQQGGGVWTVTKSGITPP